VEVSSTDEFGDLSAGFNQMAQTLQGLYQNLEAKVREKTERLEEQHQRLAALYEAAAFVARARSLEELGNGFARQLRTVAHADAVAIRWSDEGNQHYLMLASDGLPAEIVQEEACLRTHECLCGQVAAEATTRIIPIRPAEPSPMLGHCGRAGFRTVVGVPVQLQDRLVGEINLFYRQDAGLAPDDAPCWRPWPPTWPVPSRPSGWPRWNANRRWRRSAACWPASCTTPSPRACPS
jgi:two-component system nitrate/nitrite sensor histidine kinase NarX